MTMKFPMHTKEYWRWNGQRYLARLAAFVRKPNALLILAPFSGLGVGVATYYLMGVPGPYPFFWSLFFGIVGALFFAEGVAARRYFEEGYEFKDGKPIIEKKPAIQLAQLIQPAPVPVATPAVAHKFPYKIPAGRNWGNLSIQFIDNENVLINVDKWSHRTGFASMNMADTRKGDPTPNKQWQFLKALADAGGEIGFGNGEARMGFKKQKSILTDTLKKYFDLGGDPFYPYDQFRRYKARFILISNAAADGLPMVRNISTIEKKDLFEDDGEPLEEGIPEPISDEEEDDRLTDSLLDQQEAQRYGYHIEGG
jgi:hypothetical protein